MKKGIVVALFACVFALSLALVGCGGSGGGDVKSAWIGTWDLTEMEQDGEITSSDDIEMLKGLGLTVELELKDDGTGALVLFGEAMDGTWEAKSATDATFKYEGQDVAMKIADGKLTMEQDTSKLTFAKGTASSSSAASASASASASAASESAAASASSESASASGSSSSAS